MRTFEFKWGGLARIAVTDPGDKMAYEILRLDGSWAHFMWVESEPAKTAFLAMLDHLDRAEKDRNEAVRLMRRLQVEDYNADSTNLRGAIDAFLAERPTT